MAVNFLRSLPFIPYQTPKLSKADQAQLDAYNAQVEAYTKAVDDYNAYIEKWNAGPRTSDPTMQAPKELPFTQATLDTFSESAATRAQKAAEQRGLALAAAANPSQYNLAGFGFADGGDVSKARLAYNKMFPQKFVVGGAAMAAQNAAAMMAPPGATAQGSVDTTAPFLPESVSNFISRNVSPVDMLDKYYSVISGGVISPEPKEVEKVDPYTNPGLTEEEKRMGVTPSFQPPTIDTAPTSLPAAEQLKGLPGFKPVEQSPEDLIMRSEGKAEPLDAYLEQLGKPKQTLGLSSALEDAVNKIPQDKGTAQQMLAQLKKVPGVKQEEIDLTGLNDFLQGKDTVTRGEIADYLVNSAKDFQLDYEDVKRPSHAALVVPGPSSNYRERLYKHSTPDKALYQGEIVVDPSVIEAYAAKMPDWQSGDASSILNEITGEYLQRFNDFSNISKIMPTDKSNVASFKGLTRDEYNRLKESVDKWGTWGASIQNEKVEGDPLVKPVHSKHYGDDVLMHARTTDRVAVDGAKTLMIEEIQSDHHQDARKEGYRDIPRMRDLQTQMREIDQASGNVLQQIQDQNILVTGDGAGGLIFSDKNRLRNGDYTRLGFFANKTKEYVPTPFADGSQVKLLTNYAKLQKELAPLKQQYAEASKGVADVPFKDSWDILAFRQLLQEAIDNGYDRVAWTTGQEQINRYDGLDEKQQKGHIEAYDKRLKSKVQKAVKPFNGTVTKTQIYTDPNYESWSDQWAVDITPEMKQAGRIPRLANGGEVTNFIRKRAEGSPEQGEEMDPESVGEAREMPTMPPAVKMYLGDLMFGWGENRGMLEEDLSQEQRDWFIQRALEAKALEEQRTGQPVTDLKFSKWDQPKSKDQIGGFFSQDPDYGNKFSAAYQLRNYLGDTNVSFLPDGSIVTRNETYDFSPEYDKKSLTEWIRDQGFMGALGKIGAEYGTREDSGKAVKRDIKWR